MKDSKLSRRAFLGATTAAAAAAAAATGTSKLRDGERFNTAQVVPGKTSPNEKVNVAAIGAGGKGMSDIGSCRKLTDHVNVVALCDVDWERAAEAFYRIKDAKQYKDYRNMLEEMKDIDACTISTPDHTHAPAAVMAMNLGKHVYVQKPLTHTVAEARLLTTLAREKKVATQMGNQGHCGDGVRDLCEMLWSGAIGEVKECHIWTNRPVWPQGLSRPDIVSSAPETLDWDRWLGAAPYRPFVDKHPVTGNDCYRPFVWRGWWDFGCGALGDMACHIMDAANWSLKLSEAKSYSVELVSQEGMNSENGPNKSVVKYSFPARADLPPVDVYWYDGGNLPPRPADIPAETVLGDGDNGSLFIGTNGYLTTGEYGGNSRLVPDERMKDYVMPARTLERIENEDPYLNWIQAIKTGKPAASNFDYSGPFTEVVNFGNAAIRFGKKLEFDAVNFKVTNDPAANAFLTKEYRKGWEIPGLPV